LNCDRYVGGLVTQAAAMPICYADTSHTEYTSYIGSCLGASCVNWVGPGLYRMPGLLFVIISLLTAEC
jgi:hypothetical protein